MPKCPSEGGHCGHCSELRPPPELSEARHSAVRVFQAQLEAGKTLGMGCWRGEKLKYWLHCRDWGGDWEGGWGGGGWKDCWVGENAHGWELGANDLSLEPYLVGKKIDKGLQSKKIGKGLPDALEAEEVWAHRHGDGDGSMGPGSGARQHSRSLCQSIQGAAGTWGEVGGVHSVL